MMYTRPNVGVGDGVSSHQIYADDSGSRDLTLRRVNNCRAVKRIRQLVISHGLAVVPVELPNLVNRWILKKSVSSLLNLSMNSYVCVSLNALCQPSDQSRHRLAKMRDLVLFFVLQFRESLPCACVLKRSVPAIF